MLHIIKSSFAKSFDLWLNYEYLVHSIVSQMVYNYLDFRQKRPYSSLIAFNYPVDISQLGRGATNTAHRQRCTLWPPMDDLDRSLWQSFKEVSTRDIELKLNKYPPTHDKRSATLWLTSFLHHLLERWIFISGSWPAAIFRQPNYTACHSGYISHLVGWLGLIYRYRFHAFAILIGCQW